MASSQVVELPQDLPFDDWSQVQTLRIRQALPAATWQTVLSKISTAKHVTTLDLEECCCDNDEIWVRKLLGTLSLSTVTTLTICKVKLGPRGAQVLLQQPQPMEQLQFVTLSHASLGHLGAQALGRVLLHCKQLQRLDLSHNTMGHDGLWKLVAGWNVSGQPLVSLTLLDLSYNNMLDDGCWQVGQQLSYLKGLKVLKLAGNGITVAGVEGLATAAASTRVVLSELDLSHNQLDNAACRYLAKILVTLQQLDVSHNSIQDDGIAELTANGLYKLEYLDMSNNQFGDLGAGHFVELLEDTQLQTLRLEGNDISSARKHILDMLLKHRKTSTATPARAQQPIDRTDEDNDDNDDDNDLLNSDPEAMMEQGRQLLSACSQESESVVQVPAGYLRLATNNFTTNISYGAFGTLCRFHDEQLENDWIVRRIIPQSDHGGPLQEVQNAVWQEIMDAHHHLNLFPLVAAAVTTSARYLVYPLMPEQTTLREVIEEGRLMSWKERFAILLGIAQALDYLHSGGAMRKACFHGDIQPSNIFVSHYDNDDVQVQLTDGMVSRFVATDRARFASGDVVFGTRGYRCPRYERGSCQYDAFSDMFAFGVVLTEVMTGRLQRSNQNKVSLAYDVYYDVILAKEPLRTDPKAGPLPKHALDALGQIAYSCVNPVILRRPSATTVVQILGQTMIKP